MFTPNFIGYLSKVTCHLIYEIIILILGGPMQKFEFQYREHELDDLHVKSIYEDHYDSAVNSFITWVHTHGYIGYFDDKTIIGNPVNRTHVEYTSEFGKASLKIYVLEYTLLNYHHNSTEATEQKKTQLFMSESIQDFILTVKTLQNKGNIKNLKTYKGTLTAFDHTDL